MIELNKTPKIIIVLGMHRSGTSIVAQLIAKWGAYMGEELMEANKFNEDGYWEDMKLYRFHEKILKEKGNAWYAPAENLNINKLLKDYGDEAKQLIEHMDLKNQVWCWKDPRLVILLDFWNKILENRDILYIIPTRDPKAVAQSLKERDKMPYSVSLLLWEVTIVKLLEKIKNTDNHLFIYYEKLLTQPNKECEKLFNYLNEKTNIKRDAFHLQDMIASVKPSLDHSQKTTTDIKLSPFQKELYNKLIKQDTISADEILNKKTWFWKDYLDIYKRNMELSNIVNPIRIARLYIDLGEGIGAANMLIKELNINESHIEYDLQNLKSIKGLRFDPLDDYCQIKIKNISLLSGGNKFKKAIYNTNASGVNENIFDFDTKNPQIHLPLENVSDINKVIFELDFLSVGKDSLIEIIKNKNLEIKKENQELKTTKNEFANLITQKENLTKQFENKFAQQENLINNLESSVNALNSLIIQKENHIKQIESDNFIQKNLIINHELSIKQKEKKIIEYSSDIKLKETQNNSLQLELIGLNNEINEKREQIKNNEQIISSIYNSYSWRITKPLRLLNILLKSVVIFFLLPINKIKKIKLQSLVNFCKDLIKSINQLLYSIFYYKEWELTKTNILNNSEEAKKKYPIIVEIEGKINNILQIESKNSEKLDFSVIALFIKEYLKKHPSINKLINELSYCEPKIDEKSTIKQITSKTHGKKLKILYISAMFPSVGHGGGLRLFDILSHLSLKHEVDLFSCYSDYLDRSSYEILKTKIQNIKLSENHYQIIAEEIIQWLELIGKGKNYYDIIHFEYPNSVVSIKKIKKYGKKTAFTYMESVSKRTAIDISLNRNNPEEIVKLLFTLIQNIKLEILASKRTDFTIAVSEEDADYIQRITGKIPYIIPTCVSDSFITKAKDLTINKYEYDAVFVGYFDHKPNIDAVKWYYNEIHQLVKNQIPNYKVMIIGGGDARELIKLCKNDSSIYFTGFVDDISELSKAKICISPLISGAGIRGKINQYSIFERPTVSTTIGLCGTPYVDRDSVLQADNPIDFSNAISELLTDENLYNKIKVNCKKIAINNFSWSPKIKQLENIYFETNLK